MYSSPLWQWLIRARRLACVPLATNNAASLPNISAVIASSRFTVGSSPNTSSPTSAAAMASRMAWVGRVTVSLLRSISFIDKFLSLLI